MPYLIIDTTTKYGGTAIWRNGSLSRALTWHSGHNHTAELMPAVQRLLAEDGLAAEDITGVAVAIGPGGFGSLRAGMSVAKGVAFARSIPIVGISSLEASAYPYRHLGYPVCALITAGREAVAWARFQQTGDGWKRLSPDMVTPSDQLLHATGRHMLFAGEGVADQVERLREALGPRAHLAPGGMPLDRLQGVALLGRQRLDAGESDSITALQPHYLRPPGVTPPKAPTLIKYGASARP